METAKEIFKKHALLSKMDGDKTPFESEVNEAIEHKDMQFVFEAMEEFAEQQSTVVYNLFSKPMDVLKPLHDVYRMEYPSDRFYIPDATKFHEWIVRKIIGSISISQVATQGTTNQIDLEDMIKDVESENNK